MPVNQHATPSEISSVDLRRAHRGEPTRASDVDLLPGPGLARSPPKPANRDVTWS
jgi:hypothetical protein